MEKRKITPIRFSRRGLLERIARAGLGLPILALSAPTDFQLWGQQAVSPVRPPTRTPFSNSDDAFLEELEQASFKYFWGQAHPETGIVMDRCNASNPVASEL